MKVFIGIVIWVVLSGGIFSAFYDAHGEGFMLFLTVPIVILLGVGMAKAFGDETT